MPFVIEKIVAALWFDCDFKVGKKKSGYYNLIHLKLMIWVNNFLRLYVSEF